MPRGIYPRPTGYRPRKSDPPELVIQVKALYAADWTQREIAERLGIGLRGVQGLFRRNGIEPRKPTPRDQVGSRNANWKGEDASYQAMHLRLYRQRGRPFPCAICGTTTARAYDWANLTGKYSDLTDYVPMCRSCHWKHDGQVKNLR